MTLTFAIDSPTAQNVFLGASLFDQNRKSYSDPKGDITALIQVGHSTPTRSFTVPAVPNGPYTLTITVWIPGRVGVGNALGHVDCGQYGFLATTKTPANPGTIKPAVKLVSSPVQMSCALAGTVGVGNTVTLTFAIDSPTAQNVFLGASLFDRNRKSYSDPKGDITALIQLVTALQHVRSLFPQCRNGPYTLTITVWIPGRVGVGNALGSVDCGQYGFFSSGAAPLVSSPVQMSCALAGTVGVGNTVTLTFAIDDPNGSERVLRCQSVRSEPEVVLGPEG